MTLGEAMRVWRESAEEVRGLEKSLATARAKRNDAWAVMERAQKGEAPDVGETQRRVGLAGVERVVHDQGHPHYAACASLHYTGADCSCPSLQPITAEIVTLPNGDDTKEPASP